MSITAGLLAAAAWAASIPIVGGAISAGIGAVAAVTGAIAVGSVAGLTIGTVALAVSTVATVASIGLTVAGAITGDKSLMDAAFWTGIGAAVTGGVASIANSAAESSATSLASSAVGETAGKTGMDVATNAGGTAAGTTIGTQTGTALTPTFESATGSAISNTAKATTTGALGSAGTTTLNSSIVPTFESAGANAAVGESLLKSTTGKTPSVSQQISQDAINQVVTPTKLANTASKTQVINPVSEPVSTPSTQPANSVPSFQQSTPTIGGKQVSNNVLNPSFESTPNMQLQSANIGSKADVGIADTAQKSIGSTDAMGNVAGSAKGAVTGNNEGFFSDLWGKAGSASDTLEKHSTAAKLFSDLLGSVTGPDEADLAKQTGEQARQTLAYKFGLGSITQGTNSTGAYYVDNYGKLQRA